MIAALYVELGGAYFNLQGVQPWDEEKDARRYSGPFPVVAHPPCTRWGKYWHGSPRKPHQHRMGEDGGCFGAALTAVRNYGGVLEHPRDSRAWSWFGLQTPPRAWSWFGLQTPPRAGGWVKADDFGGWTCSVEQGRYGHASPKPTWLYAAHVDLPDLRWGTSTWSPDPAEVERLGFRRAQRNGALSKPGLTNRKSFRSATPAEFRDLLISIARTASPPARMVAE